MSYSFHNSPLAWYHDSQHPNCIDVELRKDTGQCRYSLIWLYWSPSLIWYLIHKSPVAIHYALLWLSSLAVDHGDSFLFYSRAFTWLYRWHSLIYMPHLLLHVRHVKLAVTDSVAISNIITGISTIIPLCYALCDGTPALHGAVQFI